MSAHMGWFRNQYRIVQLALVDLVHPGALVLLGILRGVRRVPGGVAHHTFH